MKTDFENHLSRILFFLSFDLIHLTEDFVHPMPVVQYHKVLFAKDNCFEIDSVGSVILCQDILNENRTIERYLFPTFYNEWKHKCFLCQFYFRYCQNKCQKNLENGFHQDFYLQKSLHMYIF